MKTLRAVVSGSRVRYTQNGFDLDLTYITPNLIAMGYPASGVEKTYRNDINEVRPPPIGHVRTVSWAGLTTPLSPGRHAAGLAPPERLPSLQSQRTVRQ